MREVKFFVVKDERHDKYFMQDTLDKTDDAPSGSFDLGFDSRFEHGSVQNFLEAVGAMVNRNLSPVDPDRQLACKGDVAKMIDEAMHKTAAWGPIMRAAEASQAANAERKAAINARIGEFAGDTLDRQKGEIALKAKRRAARKRGRK